MSRAPWEAALDEIERSLDEPTPLDLTSAKWQPPSGLGPLPADLADRARNLLEELDRHIADARREQTDVRTDLDRIPRSPRAAADSHPTHFDRLA